MEYKMNDKKYYIIYGFKLIKGTILNMFNNFDLYKYDAEDIDSDGNFDYINYPQLLCINNDKYEYFGIPILVTNKLNYSFNENDCYNIKRELYCLLSENNMNLGYKTKPNLQILTVWMS